MARGYLAEDEEDDINLTKKLESKKEIDERENLIIENLFSNNRKEQSIDGMVITEASAFVKRERDNKDICETARRSAYVNYLNSLTNARQAIFDVCSSTERYLKLQEAISCYRQWQKEYAVAEGQPLDLVYDKRLVNTINWASRVCDHK